MTAEKREITPEEKALVSDWGKRLESAQKRTEKIFKQFEKNRRLLAGKDGDSEETKKMRCNLHYGNMASMLPQVYAKDPEFSVSPTAGVGKDQMQAVRVFAQTAEKVISKCLVKDAKLKKQAKKLLRSAFATSIGWWKLSWQEDRRKDPLIINQIKDTQDNINRLEMLRTQLDDPSAGTDHDLQLAQLKQTLAGLETQQEITLARGLALDFVMSEDIIIIDQSIRCVTDYLRSAAMAHRVWMTSDQYETRFQQKPGSKTKTYRELNGEFKSGDGEEGCLYCVFEIWSQDDNRIYYWCDGEEGFCEEPKSPDWTGKQWFPFFGGAFNEIDGAYYPLSDVELAEALVREYNDTREDFVRDRKDSLPVNIVRKGGSLTPDDIKNIKNRQGNDIILVEGVGGQPITNDVFVGQLSNLKMENYDTNPSRQDMEMVLGGGDASRGSVLKAKTATEAEILSQGLRGRSAERQDVMEDVLNDLGCYALEILLRKMTEAEVKMIAGQDAVWPSMSIDEIFGLVSIEVRGGSTGKPDRLQEQDRWIKLMPVIEKAVTQVAELRAKGQEQLAHAVIELTKETLRRFDERIDIEQFLPPPAEPGDPQALMQQVSTLKQQLEMAMTAAKEAKEQVEKGYVQAAAQIATAANPIIAAQAFGLALKAVDGDMTAVDAAANEQAQAAPTALPTTTAPTLQ